MSKRDWWAMTGANANPVEELAGIAKRVWDAQRNRLAAARECWMLYGDNLGGLDCQDKVDPVFYDELDENQLANTIDTLHATVGKNKIVPAPITVDGDWDQQERAKVLGRFIAGVYDDNQLQESVCPKVLMDALVMGTGCYFVTHEAKKKKNTARIRVERQNVMHLAVDAVEARDGSPRTLFRKSLVDRYVLLAKVSGTEAGLVGGVLSRKAAVLEAAAGDHDDIHQNASGDHDMVLVHEVWRLPSCEGAEDGRYVCWIGDTPLISRSYERERFPFAFITLGHSAGGFFGKSPIQRIAPCQRALTKLAKRIDSAHDLLGVPRLLVRNDSNVLLGHLDNEIGSIVRYDGAAPPQEWNATPITPDAYRERDSLPGRMRSLIGVSNFDSDLSLPAGIRDGAAAAMERYQDASTARHVMIHRQYEKSHVALADVILDEAYELESLGVNVFVTAPGESKTSVQKISFKDCSVDRDVMRLRILPMSQLPQTFSGRVSELSRLKDDGIISPRMYRALLDVPDIEAEMDLQSANEEVIRKTLSAIVKEKRYYEPLPTDDHQLARILATQTISLYRVRDNADDEVIGLLARYLEDCDMYLNPPAPPAPPAPIAPPGIPGAPEAGAPVPGMLPAGGPGPVLPTAPGPGPGSIPQ